MAANRGSFGRNKSKQADEVTPEASSENEINETVNNENEDSKMEDTTTVENESSEEITEMTETASEKVENEETPAFDLDNLPITGMDMIDNVAANSVKRIKVAREIAETLTNNANLATDTEIINYAKDDDADATVKSLYARYEEMRKAVDEAYADLKTNVLSAKGITPLTDEDVKAKTEEFETLRAKVISATDALNSLAGSLDEIPEEMPALITNIRAAIPVLPGQRKVSVSGTRTDSAPKPRLGDGYILVNGENLGKNIAPAIRTINGKLPSGANEISQSEFIGAWMSAAGISKWQDAPKATKFTLQGMNIEIHYLPKS